MPHKRLWLTTPESWTLNPAGSYRLLGGAISLAIAIRLYLFWQYYCISTDGVMYIDAARHFLQGRVTAGLSSYYPPGYPVLIAALYLLIGDLELSGQISSFFSGVLLLIPLYVFHRTVYGEKHALIACFLAAIAPYLARYSVDVRSDSPFLLFSMIALVLIHRGMENRSRNYFFHGGLITGFAYLIRPEAIGFLVITAITLCIQYLLEKNCKSQRFFAGLVPLLLGFSLFALPYILFLSWDTGQLAISRKAPDIIQSVVHHPLLSLEKVAVNLVSSINAYLRAIHYPYLPFLALGLALSFRERIWQRKDFVLFIFLLFYLTFFALTYFKFRYALQLVPASLGWTASGVLSCLYYGRKFTSRLFSVLLTATALIFLVGTLPKTLKPIAYDKAYIREVGRHLASLNPQGGLKLVVSDGRIAFYAGAKPILLTTMGEKELIQYLQYARPHYIAVDAERWRDRYPSVARNPLQYGLTMERQFRSVGKIEFLVFKVNAGYQDTAR